ncbi:hypothetical protein RHOSPDRAFT_36270 [Rhodotorula sp. JG-1b]|nr:hypothetical protein RHOSPDRAFT_36270 [Rhodotorula sp. JG-1b]
MPDLESLLELARDWMPRHGTKVKTLVLTWWTEADLRNLHLAPRKNQEALGAAERFVGLTTSPAQPDKRAFDLHDALVATILQACSEPVDLELVRYATKTLYVIGEHGNPLLVSSSRTDGALHQIGRRISSAGFSFEREYFTAIERLKVLPNIKHLKLRIGEGFSYEEGNFFHKVSQLQEVVSLELDDAITSTWGVRLMELAKVPTFCPIVSLCLRDFSMSQDQPRFSRPDSLKVENLSIAGRTSNRLRDLFDVAPLKNVELCACRRGRNSDRVSPKRITAFIKKHRASLLSFKTDGVLFAAAELSAINRSLEEEGISVRVVTVG